MIDQIIIDNAFGSLTDDPNIGLNMDVKLRNGGRKAPKGGAKKLEIFFDDELSLYEDPEIPQKFFDDVKYEIDFENWQVVPKVFTTSTGIDYLMMFAGGDWQEPALVLIYWDGKTFRAYVPLKGNRINPITKMAFGEEDNYLILKENNIDVDVFYKKIEGLNETPINIPACIEDFESRLQIK